MKKKYLVEKVSYFVVYATIIFATVFITNAVHGAELVEAKVVSYEPVYYEIVNRRPNRVCHDVLVPIERHNSRGGSIGESIDRKFGSTGGLVGAVLGVGLARGVEAVSLPTIGKIFASWLVTLPAGAGLAIVFFYLLSFMFGA